MTIVFLCAVKSGTPGMTDPDTASARLIEALTDLTQVTAAVPSDSALDSFDKTTNEVFFRDWPTVRSWAESLCQRLDDEFGHAALPDHHPRSPETGVGD